MLSHDEFLKICKLAKLDIDEVERNSFIGKLNNIFAWIEQLHDIDTSNIDISKDILARCPEREDVSQVLKCRAEVLSNTQNRKFDMFAVPKVVE